jgi:type IV pilus assembly protein PilQ
VAALGNATARVAAPTLQLLTSLVLGRHQLIAFIDALQSVQLSDIEATPQVTVLDNQIARIHVGEITPIRTIDAGAGGAAGGQFPTAQVSQQETGVILNTTPHVTADGNILLEVQAERSAAELADSDAGFIFRTQSAQTRVLVQDGETVVIGGLTQTERTSALAGIPLLKDLPLIGALFRTRREQVIQRDLIILVTPHIVRGGL